MKETQKAILLVEDNEDDLFFMRQAMGKAGFGNPLQVASTGQEAIDYLLGSGIYSDRVAHPLPFLVLLDLKLPYIPGLEVLKWIRERRELRNILVVVLTSSREDRDIDTAYSLGANSYIVKPPTAEKLNDMVRSLGEYWTLKNQPPIHIGQTAI